MNHPAGRFCCSPWIYRVKTAVKLRFTAGCIFLDQPPRIAPRGPTWGAIGSRRAFFRNAIVDCRLNHCETRCKPRSLVSFSIHPTIVSKRYWRIDTKVLSGYCSRVSLWTSSCGAALRGTCRKTDEGVTAAPTPGHALPLRCDFGPGVCQRYSGYALSPYSGRGTAAC